LQIHIHSIPSSSSSSFSFFMLGTTYRFSLSQLRLLVIYCLSGTEIPLSELANSIFGDQVAGSCVDYRKKKVASSFVGGEKVLVHSDSEVVNIFSLKVF
jgi:hypothetical protein